MNPCADRDVIAATSIEVGLPPVIQAPGVCRFSDRQTRGEPYVKRGKGKAIAILLAAGIAAGMLAAGCAKKDVKQEAVATVNGEEIRVVELRERLGVPVGLFAVTNVPADKKKEALDRLVAGRLLAQDARSRGLDNTPEFREIVRQNEPGVRISALFRKEVDSKLKVDDKAVKAEADKIREADKGIPDADASARATKAVADAQVRKIQEDLVATAKKETGAAIDQAAIDRIAKGERTPDNTVLATAGDEKINYGDVKRIIQAAGGAPGQKDLAKNPSVIGNILNRELTVRALAAYAGKQGIDGTEWYRTAHKEMERSVLGNMVADEVGAKDVSVTDKEIEAAYAEHAQMLVRNGKKIPLSEVKEQLRAFLQNDKRRKALEAYIAGLKPKAKITVNDAALAKV